MGTKDSGTPEKSKRNANGKKTSASPQQQDRKHGRQYYYFYGSTSESSGQGGSHKDNNANSRMEPISPTAMTNETDSLVGESLIPTDNEDETPKNSENDYRQLLVSHPNGNGGLHPLPEHPRRARKPTCSPFLSCYKSFRRQHPAYQVIWAIGVGALVVLLSLMLFPESKLFHSAAKAATSTPPEAQQLLRNFEIKFPQVDRGTYGDPVSKFLDASLFHSSLLNTDRKTNNTDKRTFRFPFPTGAFWTNLVLPPTADRGLSFPVAVYPYAYKWSDFSLEASYPAQHRKENNKEIHDYFFPDLTLSSSQNVTARKVIAFDPLSVQLRYYTAGRKNSFWETYLVQGSPYITLKYSSASPIIHAFTTFTGLICPREDQKRRTRRRLKFGVCYSNNNTTEQVASRLTTLHGVQFIIETQEGVRWIAFSSELISLKLNTTTRTTITAEGEDGNAFSGILRLAILPPTQDQQHGADGVTTQTATALDQIEYSKGMQRLIYHAGVYPVSGGVSWSFRSSDPASSTSKSGMYAAMSSGFDSSSSTPSASSSSTVGRIATVEFKFKTRSFTETSTTPNLLLMLALPHHAQKLSPSIQLGMDQFDLVYKCIKGPMRPVVGSAWSYDEDLPMLGFDGDSGSSLSKQYLDPAVKRTILKSLQEDVKLAHPTATEDVYGFGKQAARLAQIAHIARNMLSHNNTSSGKPSTKSSGADSDEQAIASEVLDKAKLALYHVLDLFLTGKISDGLVYDANLGGIVTSNGLRNSEADFGNGRYNDHHFHYGYLMYAAAILGKLDPSFVDSHGQYVDAIYHDVAHESNFDSIESTGVFLPGSRHKMWFDGHSFASGLFPFGNGKSQESSSEAVNCYYGAYLWSLTRNGAAENPSSDDSLQTDFARLLLAMEVRGARTYWHMLPPDSKRKNQTDSLSVYTPEFAENYMGTLLSRSSLFISALLKFMLIFLLFIRVFALDQSGI